MCEYIVTIFDFDKAITFSALNHLTVPTITWCLHTLKLETRLHSNPMKHEFPKHI